MIFEGAKASRKDNLDLNVNADCATDAASSVVEQVCKKSGCGRARSDCKSYWSMARVMLALLLVLSQITCIVGVVPDDEIFALESFYSSTNGDDWLWRREDVFGPRWNFTSDDINPCKGEVWQGIQCSRGASLCAGTQICHITSIVLNRYRIRGTLPNELGLLSYLSSFELAINLLYGPMPDTLESLAALSVSILHTFHSRTCYWGTLCMAAYPSV